MFSLRQPRPKVKAPRKTARTAGRFGAGLTFTAPVYSADHSASDEAWYAASTFSPNAIDDEAYDRMAAEAEWLARYERGLTEADRCDLCGLLLDPTDVGPTCAGCRFADQWDGIV